MKAYMFAAALLCEDCGKATCDQLRASIKELHPEFDESNEYTFDSDYFPKGPYSEGGGEADWPQHCDMCRVFLANPLTDEGHNYVLDAANDFYAPEDDPALSWSEIADKAEAAGSTPEGNGPVVAEWIRYYLAPGM